MTALPTFAILYRRAWLIEPKKLGAAVAAHAVSASPRVRAWGADAPFKIKLESAVQAMRFHCRRDRACDGRGRRFGSRRRVGGLHARPMRE